MSLFIYISHWYLLFISRLSMHIRSLGGEILFSNSCIKSSSYCLVPGPVLAAAVFARERSATRHITPCVGREFSRPAEVSAWFYGRRGRMFRKCQLFQFFQMPLLLIKLNCAILIHVTQFTNWQSIRFERAKTCCENTFFIIYKSWLLKRFLWFSFGINWILKFVLWENIDIDKCKSFFKKIICYLYSKWEVFFSREFKKCSRIFLIITFW